MMMKLSLIVLLSLGAADGFVTPGLLQLRPSSSRSCTEQRGLVLVGPRSSQALHGAFAAKRRSNVDALRMMAEGNSLGDSVAAAPEGSKIVLGKGTHDLGDATLILDREVSIVGEAGVPREDIVIKCQAPFGERHSLAEITAAVTIEGVTLVYPGGDPEVGLGSGKEAVCLRVRESGCLTLRDCVVSTGAGAGVTASGIAASVKVDTCRVGPCGWEGDSRHGYGVALLSGAKGDILNTDLYRLGGSGVLCFGEGTTSNVIMCDIGPCILSCVAAEGSRSVIQAKQVKMGKAAFKQVAEINGGDCILEDCHLDEAMNGF